VWAPSKAACGGASTIRQHDFIPLPPTCKDSTTYGCGNLPATLLQSEMQEPQPPTTPVCPAPAPNPKAHRCCSSPKPGKAKRCSPQMMRIPQLFGSLHNPAARQTWTCTYIHTEQGGTNLYRGRRPKWPPEINPPIIHNLNRWQPCPENPVVETGQHPCDRCFQDGLSDTDAKTNQCFLTPEVVSDACRIASNNRKPFYGTASEGGVAPEQEWNVSRLFVLPRIRVWLRNMGLAWVTTKPRVDSHI
jgi:hypothetical protein